MLNLQLYDVELQITNTTRVYTAVVPGQVDLLVQLLRVILNLYCTLEKNHYQYFDSENT